MAGRPTPRLLDAGVAFAAFAASLGLLFATVDESVGAVEVLLAAAASLPLAARRRYPLAVFVGTALASTALYGFAQPAGPPIGPTAALYFLAAAGEQNRGRTPVILATVAVLLVAHASAGGIADDRFPAAELAYGVLVWGGAWLAGDRARLRRERMAELEDRALRAEREAERERRLAAAEERTRIARDLHDSAGHAINVILVHAGLGRLRSEQGAEGVRAEFETIEQVARETVGEIDQMVGALREEDHVDGEVEPPPGLAALDALVARHRAAGMEVATSVRGDRRPLTPAVDRGAYRILQEALTNAARHGDGRAEMELDFGDHELAVTVENPLGDEPLERAPDAGHGLAGMRERAELLGGRFEAGPRAGRFRVGFRVPLVRP